MVRLTGLLTPNFGVHPFYDVLVNKGSAAGPNGPGACRPGGDDGVGRVKTLPLELPPRHQASAVQVHVVVVG